MFNQLFNSVGDFFSLDIGSNSIKGVQLRGGKNGLARYHRSPIDGRIVHSDSEADKITLANGIKDFIKAGRFTGKDVVAGIASNDVYMTLVDIPKISEKDLKKSIKYQLEQYVPIPLDEAKVDWKILGQSPGDETKVEILISSVSNAFIESRLEVLELAGLNVVAFEPDSLALSRALMDPQSQGAHMILDIGPADTDLVVVHQQTPKLIRSISTGGQALVKATKNSLGVDDRQAEQFVYKFGMNGEKLEGQVRKAIEPTANIIIEEVKKSITFFTNRYKDAKIERIVLTGASSTIPELPLHFANMIGIQVEIGNAWLNVTYPDNNHNELMSVSNNFAVASGLSQRKGGS